MRIISANGRLGYALFLIGLAVLFTLGAWQLKRGLEKADIASVSNDQDTQARQITHAPARWQDLNYRPVILEGQWVLDRTFLLDNRLLQGRPGYEVLMPYKLSGDDTVLLVNRGWIEKPASGPLRLPQPGADNPIKGQLYLPQKGFTLGETFTGNVSWPLIILYYDFESLSQALEAKIQPVVLVLDSGHPDSFVRIWQPATIPASRHYGYAVQWWGLALTLFIFGMIWRRKARVTH